MHALDRHRPILLQARHEISLGSISEVLAGLDLAKMFGLIKSSDYDHLISFLKLAYVKINALP
jgi:hypothetical protein